MGAVPSSRVGRTAEINLARDEMSAANRPDRERRHVRDCPYRRGDRQALGGNAPLAGTRALSSGLPPGKGGNMLPMDAFGLGALTAALIILWLASKK